MVGDREGATLVALGSKEAKASYTQNGNLIEKGEIAFFTRNDNFLNLGLRPIFHLTQEIIAI
jgi:hypothetical protein